MIKCACECGGWWVVCGACVCVGDELVTHSWKTQCEFPSNCVQIKNKTADNQQSHLLCIINDRCGAVFLGKCGGWFSTRGWWVVSGWLGGWAVG